MGERCRLELSKQAAGVFQQLCAHAHDDCVVPSKDMNTCAGLRPLTPAQVVGMASKSPEGYFRE